MIMPVAVCVALGTLLGTVAIPAVAEASVMSVIHDSAASPGVPIQGSPQYRAVNVKNEGDVTGNLVICGHGVNDTSINGVTFTCSETVSSSTTVQANATYTAKDISTALGFSISHTYTYSTTLGLSVPLPAHKQANIDFGTYYEKVYSGLETRLCYDTTCEAWSAPTYFTEEKALAPAIEATDETST
jgi:hypothetical protein